jgi:HAD superfamily PSPase-like hydrolase
MKYKLICFDVDGTLIDDTIYIWVTLHDAFKVPQEGRKKYYDAYISKKITYSEWFNLDIVEWQKLHKRREDFIEVIKKLKVMKGAPETIAVLRDRGYKIAIVSGSLDIVVDTLLPGVDFDEILINKLIFSKNGKISKGIPTPYDMEHKVKGLEKIARDQKISLEECVFIGDNENDIHIARAAGLSIAFNVKSEKLAEVSDIVIKEKDLLGILRYL